MERPAWETLPQPLRERLLAEKPEEQLYEIRLRAGRRMQLKGRTQDKVCGAPVSSVQLMQIASALMEYSLYAWEDELSRGYFTTQDGFRVGVAGRYRMIDGEQRLIDIHSMCIRIAREMRGSADAIIDRVRKRSCLIVSPPGCGKTTLLRDIARQLAEAGQTVAILDERCEIAAVRQGISTMDVGERTDVVEGVGKPVGLPMIVRSLAPQVLITDELGGDADAAAVLDALRCGVQVIASAHAASLDDAMARHSLRPLLQHGFDMVAELCLPPGTIRMVHVKENGVWREAGET